MQLRHSCKKGRPYGNEPVKPGSVISVLVNTEEGTLSFEHDKVNLGVAFRDEQFISNHLYPAISISKSNNVAQILNGSGRRIKEKFEFFHFFSFDEMHMGQGIQSNGLSLTVQKQLPQFCSVLIKPCLMPNNKYGIKFQLNECLIFKAGVCKGNLANFDIAFSDTEHG